MASQIPGNSLSVAEVQSYIRGYHVYMDVWTPSIGETLLLRREPENPNDKSAVAVVNDGEVVGHIPYNMSNIVSQFLRRDYNKAFTEVTGDKVNRGAGYGLEIPCIYKFYGPEPYVKKLREVLQALKANGLL